MASADSVLGSRSQGRGVVTSVVGLSRTHRSLHRNRYNPRRADTHRAIEAGESLRCASCPTNAATVRGDTRARSRMRWVLRNVWNLLRSLR